MSSNKRKENMDKDIPTKRVKKECSYGTGCYRKNPAHFREYSHRHLETILDEHTGGDYKIPDNLRLQRLDIQEQLAIIVDKQLYTPQTEGSQVEQSPSEDKDDEKHQAQKTGEKIEERKSRDNVVRPKSPLLTQPAMLTVKVPDGDYRPMVQPAKRAQDFLKVVVPTGKMAAKHASSAPYHIFYTTISSARDTHNQATSITFQEILDISLGELKCSLQINFMVEIGWLLAQYYFAGYSNKKLTILYGEDSADLRTITTKKPHVDAHQVSMATPFGKHHTKMMILCYEDGSLRVVISTANLYYDDWENRTQGLWFSPRCPPLPESSMPFEGESPTCFKKSLLKYLNHYHMPQLSFYVERVKRCDFSHINVFLVASVPGGHFDLEWGMTRMGSLLRQHCEIPAEENTKWDLIAQASSIGSYGKEPRLWLTGDFHHNFCKIRNQPQMLTTSFAKLKIIYPSLENVQGSHDGLLGGGCLPYAGSAHEKQLWLKDYLYQWKASSSGRDRAMPHIKSYTRLSPDCKRTAYYLITSANVSKAAWGVVNKGNAALRIMSYEAGVLLLPKFVTGQDFFTIDKKEGSLYIPYDLPPTKYTSDMIPWVSDYLG